ncbi:DNA cytosine methyltransferase [Xylanibacter ruminicola]|uniref:DNA cytosine methyltransferase n=1 Tax=Xylanibacter ruminicola TaxID=839 RepID=UPI00055B81AB|nr:DNA cytosine methyltransferase [Xylanibacter ruminicola]
MLGLSLFSSAGVGEAFLSDIGLDIIVANELIEKRANLHNSLYPNCKTICGDIRDDKVFSEIIRSAKGIEFLLASPPCQGMSIAGKNRHQESMIQDSRNFLIDYVFESIELLKPKYILIENVKQLLDIKLPFKGELHKVVDILKIKFGKDYCIDAKTVDASDYGVPQTRIRAIIKMFPKESFWPWPEHVQNKKTVRDTIGHLPSLEAGEVSDIKWHYARPHSENNILCMKHTPTGCSAFANPIYYPKKKDGSRVKGYESSYRRIKWDEPAPTITIRNDCIASQRNVHPGRLLPDGTYSDARVLTPLELMLLNSLPANWAIPDDTPEILIRQVIGESIPPLMLKEIIKEIPSLK